MTPFEIEVLLHYYYSPVDYNDITSSAFTTCIKRFKELDLIREVNSEKAVYKGNFEALEVYVKALCEVPLPINKWVMPND